jgi:hypothetical protein
MEPSHSDWKALYVVGAVAAIVMVVLIPLQSLVYLAWPPPATVAGYFALFQRNWLRGLLGLDLLYLADSTLMILIYLALYMALKRAGESLSLIALGLALVGTAAYFASNPAFEMRALSVGYAAATTDAQRGLFLAAGEALLAGYRGTAFDVYYIFNAVALLCFSWVMLCSTVFSRVHAYLGFASGLLMLVPSSVDTIGPLFGLLSLIPWVFWLMAFARRLIRLTR